MNDVLKVVKAASVEAGKLLMKRFHQTHTITYKDSKDIVTEADLASESFLKQTLSKEFPEFGFVAEESGQQNEQARQRFVIDPLDGTVNFAIGIPLFAVSIGIEENQRIVGGVIHAPVLQDTWWAFQNEGAFHNGEKLQVSKTDQLARSVVYTNDMNVGKERKESLNQKKYDWMKNVGSRVQRYRSIGSAAIELAWVAQGSLDAYFGDPLYYWDWAAGSILIREAGGTFSQTNGKDATPETETILGSNGKLHHALIERLA